MSNTVSTDDIERRKPVLISSGEPAGIGPDLLISLCQSRVPQAHGRDLVVMADPEMLMERAFQLRLPLHIREYSVYQPQSEGLGKGELLVLPVSLQVPVRPGVPAPENAQVLLDMLDTGCDMCLQDKAAALVTAPLSKAVISQAGTHFTGHTEYLAVRCGQQTPVMLLAGPELKIALVTTHIPLREVSAHITAAYLKQVLCIVAREVARYFGPEEPEILVCGLNPHAGEEGYLGTEEQEIIAPVIEELRHQGLHLHGPVSADTAFGKQSREECDVFVCMYHDQGLPVLKAMSFHQAVNITLGLPIIRTSVDHGTAFELAASGMADDRSMHAAIDMAGRMAHRLQQRVAGV